MARSGNPPEKPRNINFRQTPKEFRSAKVASVFAQENRNLPYSASRLSKEQFGKFQQKFNTRPARNFQARKNSQ
ncbi:MAG: hypothetical protein A3H88_01700 [Candidatus Blackburnbacteria bacterium RIFCSPLOWO2_02_FULL_44_9]|uniref:Uncharacterized protein n=1 Tax=Candidatus Blackburnbacteria bacterium RIFCSPHIGHO2_02_FULL_44_20 TaxID=1797516 RepID=A0A1G1V9T4_9BACT|nr:MAG: hypothetical protein A3D26_04145 [Candidatus Blackburnbacteria bacterium RIFCSPHIGHO2_02_FULL_44_20]OGY15928.1 MAG: hypothetical protein A3H88_01700 [Candidatus Blackburnbacteria bacterium RIFCSPLOWO2_02_FULL_44_9]